MDEAFKNNELTEEQYRDALDECDLIVDQMGTDIEETEKWCSDILNMVYEQITNGLKPIGNRISCQRNIGKE